MRVYLAASWDQLAQLVDGPVEIPLGHAVTPEVRAELADSDDEELEYLALGMAASDAIHLAGSRNRRVVLAADVDATPTGALSEVSLSGPVSLADVASLHVDSAEAEADVAASAAAPGDDRLAERALEHELGWYAVQELGQLLGSATWA